MSNVRVVFAEVDGSDEMIRSVISQMTEKVGARVAVNAVPMAETPRLLRAAPTKMPRNTRRLKTAVAPLGGGRYIIRRGGHRSRNVGPGRVAGAPARRPHLNPNFRVSHQGRPENHQRQRLPNPAGPGGKGSNQKDPKR